MHRQRFENALEWIVVPFVLALIAIGFVAVCLRYFAGGQYAIFWSEEVIRYGFIWIFWLCAPVLVSKGSMFVVDVLTQVLPGLIRRPLQILVNLLVMVLVGAYVYQGGEMTLVNIEQESSALRFPIALVYLAIPVGSSLIFIVTAVQTLQLLGLIRSRDPGAPEPQETRQ